jgi:hypothetical protein
MIHRGGVLLCHHEGNSATFSPVAIGKMYPIGPDVLGCGGQMFMVCHLGFILQ